MCTAYYTKQEVKGLYRQNSDSGPYWDLPKDMKKGDFESRMATLRAATRIRICFTDNLLEAFNLFRDAEYT